MANIFKSFAEEITEFYLSRKERAFVLTLIVLIFIVLGLMFLQLRSVPKEIMLEFVIPKEDFVDIEKLLEEEKLLEDQSELKVTTHAFNEADGTLQHSDEVFKTLEELMAEQEELYQSEGQDNSDNGIDGDGGNAQSSTYSTSEKPQETLKLSASVSQESKFVNKNSYVKYSLEGREDHNLPIPIYTCDASGMIVINITVNNLGQVINTSYNAKSSTSTNGCLIDQAVLYARQSRFDKSSKPQQIGTITYHFQPK